MDVKKTALIVSSLDNTDFASNLSRQYNIFSRVFLVLAYRTIKTSSDRLLEEQINVCARGEELYQLLGICKVPFSDIYEIFIVYQGSISMLRFTDFYFIEHHGYHWFEGDEDDFLALYEDVAEEQYPYSNLEEDLEDEFVEAMFQKDETDTACEKLLGQYQIPPETELCEKLVKELGYAFYSSDAEDEPQTNMYLFRSRMLYELYRGSTSPDIPVLFSILFDGGFVVCQNAIYYAKVQGYEDGYWAVDIKQLYILCVLTQYGRELSKCDRNIAEAIEEDALWFLEQKERGKDEGRD